MGKRNSRRRKAAARRKEIDTMHGDPRFLDPQFQEYMDAVDRGDLSTFEDPPPTTKAMTGPVRGQGGRFESSSRVVSHTPSTPAVPTFDLDLFRQLRAMMGVKLAPVTQADLTTPITWVLAGNGVFQYRTTKYGIAQICMGKASIKGLPDIKPEVQLAVPKMPWTLLVTIVAFLTWVKKTHDTEGLVRAYYRDSDRMWTLHVPKQVVSGASVEISDDEPAELPDLGEFAIEIHSHPGASSTFSGTDDANEQRERIFGCVADLNAGTPNFHWRLGTGTALWQDLETSDIVDAREKISFDLSPLDCLREKFTFNPFRAHSEFPEHWKAQVEKKSYRYTPSNNSSRVTDWKPSNPEPGWLGSGVHVTKSDGTTEFHTTFGTIVRRDANGRSLSQPVGSSNGRDDTGVIIPAGVNAGARFPMMDDQLHRSKPLNGD